MIEKTKENIEKNFSDKSIAWNLKTYEQKLDDINHLIVKLSIAYRYGATSTYAVYDAEKYDDWFPVYSEIKVMCESIKNEIVFKKSQPAASSPFRLVLYFFYSFLCSTREKILYIYIYIYIYMAALEQSKNIRDIGLKHFIKEKGFEMLSKLSPEKYTDLILDFFIKKSDLYPSKDIKIILGAGNNKNQTDRLGNNYDIAIDELTIFFDSSNDKTVNLILNLMDKEKRQKLIGLKGKVSKIIFDYAVIKDFVKIEEPLTKREYFENEDDFEKAKKNELERSLDVKESFHNFVMFMTDLLAPNGKFIMPIRLVPSTEHQLFRNYLKPKIKSEFSIVINSLAALGGYPKILKKIFKKEIDKNIDAKYFLKTKTYPVNWFTDDKPELSYLELTYNPTELELKYLKYKNKYLKLKNMFA